MGSARTAGREDHCPFDLILKLADVAGPIILLKQIHAGRIEFADLLLRARSKARVRTYVCKALDAHATLNQKQGESAAMAGRIVRLLIAAIFVGAMNDAIGAEMFAYPEKGQSHEQQLADQQYCETWADQQAGSISSSPGAQSSPSQEQMRGGPLRGAMRGRMIGEAGGESNAGTMGGGMGGGMIRRRIEQKREEEQARPAYHGKTDAHNRAFKACMEGRGYTVE